MLSYNGSTHEWEANYHKEEDWYLGAHFLKEEDFLATKLLRERFHDSFLATKLSRERFHELHISLKETHISHLHIQILTFPYKCHHCATWLSKGPSMDMQWKLDTRIPAYWLALMCTSTIKSQYLLGDRNTYMSQSAFAALWNCMLNINCVCAASFASISDTSAMCFVA